MSQLDELGFRTAGHRAAKPRRFAGCIAVLIAMAIVGGAGWVVWDRGQDWLTGVFDVPDYEGTGAGDVTIQVLPGQGTRDIGVTLEEAGVVESAEAFTRAARNDDRALSIQPGFYELREEMSGQAALSLILDPTARLQEQVTIPEGLRRSRVLDRLTEGSGLEKAEFQEVLREQLDTIELPEYADGNPEGFLFPARYDIDPGTTAQGLLRSMVARFEQEAASLDLVAGADRLGMTPREIVIVASLIEAEVNQPDDYARVARVIYNRLDSPEFPSLQFDSTVSYATGKQYTVWTTDEDRAIDSPYNTYRVEGLPIGPINSPGSRSLEAALNPADGDWVYFMPINLETGETRFASSFAEHEQNVAELQQWCQDNQGKC